MKRMKQLLCITLALSMLLCLAACGKKPETKAEAAPLHIATKPMTEQYILGEMLKLIIEDRTDYTCEITKGVGGGTSNIMPAMKSGDFDLYPEYTASGYVLVLEHDAKGVEDDAMWEQLLKEYHDKFGMTWLGHYGFNNTYCLTIETCETDNDVLSKILMDFKELAIINDSFNYIVHIICLVRIIRNNIIQHIFHTINWVIARNNRCFFHVVLRNVA